MQLTIVYTDKYRLGGPYYTLWNLYNRTFKVWPVAQYIRSICKGMAISKKFKTFPLCLTTRFSFLVQNILHA